MNRRELIEIAAVTLLGFRPSCAVASGAPAAPLRAVRRPCSLRKVCHELARRFNANVFADEALADLRVVWAFNADPSLEATLARLAELTDSRVVTRNSVTGKPRFILERSVRTTLLEAAWRRERLLRAMRELLRAADDYEQGKLNAAAFSPGVRTYLGSRASQLKYLRRLSPEQMDRLLEGEEIRFLPGAVPDVEVRQLVSERHSRRPEPDEDPARLRGYMERELRETRQRGLGLWIDFNRRGPFFHLMLDFGGRGANVLCRFGEDELGLPLTRTNPYRLLETGTKGAPPPALPAAFHRRLTENVLLPPGGTCEAAVQDLARVAHVDLVSDGYLCRSRMAASVRPGQSAVLAPRGATVAEALDLLCQRYDYLWWQKDGCAYLRARAWPWDVVYEVPDRFLDTWTAALERRRALGPAEIAELASLTPLQLSGLANLGSGGFEVRSSPGEPEVRQFLTFFRWCGPPKQARLLGPGLVVGPDEAPTLDKLIHPLVAGAPPHPILLRLAHNVSPDPRASPPATRVKFTLTRSWQQARSESWFEVEIPHLGSPFVP